MNDTASIMRQFKLYNSSTQVQYLNMHVIRKICIYSEISNFIEYQINLLLD